MSPRDLLASIGPRAIFDSLGDGVYITDLERNILHWNRAAEQITGWSTEEVVGRSCYDNVLIHEDKDGNRICGKDACPLHRAIVTGQRSTEPVIIFAQSKFGQRIPVQITVAPIHDARGEIVGGVEIFRDLTELFGDLERAKVIQRGTLECVLPTDPRASFSVHCVQHDQVGGDFHRIEAIDEDHVAVMVADVMGHGVAAALYTMQLRALWEDLREHRSDPAAFVTELDRRLSVLTQASNHFASALYAVLSLDGGELRGVNAGHPPPLLFRRGEVIGMRESDRLPLGFFDGSANPEFTFFLQPGDSLLIHSDGAIEIEDREGQMLDTGGLGKIALSLLQGREEIPLSALAERLLEFSQDVRLPDDVTLVQIHMTRG